MKWSEICIHTTEEAVDAVTNILYEAGAGGVVIEDSQDLKNSLQVGEETGYALDPADYPMDGVNVKAYLPVNSFLGETVKGIRQSLGQLHLFGIELGDGLVTFSEHNEEEWAHAWKKYYKPVCVGRSFYITPCWENDRPADQKRKVITLDPGMAFGTGTHPTTVLCIEALEKYLPEGADVLDIGTGTGVLAIAAAKLGARHVRAVDIDPVAVASARANVARNAVQHLVTVSQNDLAGHVDGQFTVVTANLLAELVIRLTETGVADLIGHHGRLIVSGIIKPKKEQVVRALAQAKMCIVDEMESGDWIALIARKAN